MLLQSGWVSVYLKNPMDVDRGIWILRRSYEIARKQMKRRSTNQAMVKSTPANDQSRKNVYTKSQREIIGKENRMSKKLKGKVAVVTGASKGIGAAIAKQLAAEGAAVVVNYASSKEGADRVVAEIAAEGGKAVAVQANVAKPAEIERLFAEAIDAFGRLDILVNNAGIYEFSPLEDDHRGALPQAFRPERPRSAAGSQGSGKALRLRGRQHHQHQFSREHGCAPNTSVYSATKAAVDAVTRSLAKELGPRNIRVNAINPGMVETEGVHAAGITESDFRKQSEAQTPLGRIGQPQDIGRRGGFLASVGCCLDHGRNAPHLGRTPLRSTLCRHAMGDKKMNGHKLITDRAIYWTTTGIVCFVMVFSIVNFTFVDHFPYPEGAFVHLGLPNYFKMELTVAKALGVLALLLPRIPRKLKEFAYFGFLHT